MSPISAEAGQRLQLTHAMLGLRYWLPRHSAVAEPNLPVSQRAFLAPQKTAGEPANGDFDSSANRPALAPAHEVAAAAEKSQPVVLAEGVVLCGSGVLLFERTTSQSWFFPLPWRGAQGWCAWRDAGEGQLLEAACDSVGLDAPVQALLRRYHQQQLDFATLPDETVLAQDVLIPDSVKEVITFSGLSWQCLAGESKAEDRVMIDWHGREVRVRCLPHPYRCLLDASSKKALWQGLVKLKYEL